jgi:hypothetical protein
VGIRDFAGRDGLDVEISVLAVYLSISISVHGYQDSLTPKTNKKDHELELH